MSNRNSPTPCRGDRPAPGVGPMSSAVLIRYRRGGFVFGLRRGLRAVVGEQPVVCDDVERRILGIENEYGVTCTFRGQRRLSPDEVARYLFRRVVSLGPQSATSSSRNGARLYLDVGSHPEYATPECDDVAELVAHDKAGERILEGLLVDAEQRLREEGIRGDIYLFKNNTDSAGNSYGCHENYLVEPARRVQPGSPTC